jgi:pyrroloquinoline quinone biosynthesis protein D
MARTSSRKVSPAVVLSDDDRPRLARHARLAFSEPRQRSVLLLPETVVVLNPSGADILARCDGRHTVAGIVTELRARYRSVADGEVRMFLSGLLVRRCLEIADGEPPDD